MGRQSWAGFHLCCVLFVCTVNCYPFIPGDSLSKYCQRATQGRCRQDPAAMYTLCPEICCERRVNDLEQYTRRNNVRVFGVSEPHGETVEDCETKVLKILNEKLELRRMESGDIEAAHRIGKPVQRRGGGQQPARPRPIIVRFLSRKATEVVLRNRRKLKNSGIVIVEDLTHENFILLHKCRDHAGVQDAWARRGSIYVKTVRDSKIQKISQASDLQLLPVVPATSTPTSQSQQRQRSPLQSDQSLMATNANSIEDKRVSGDSNGHQSQGGDCRDVFPDCARLAKKGYCKTLPADIIYIMCPKTCIHHGGTCMDNPSGACGHYKKRGECQKHPKWMYSNCPKSCKICDVGV